MAKHTFLMISCVLYIGYTYGQQQQRQGPPPPSRGGPGGRAQGGLPNSPIMQIKKSVDKKLCSDTDYPQDIITRIEDCDKFDPHYKIDMMYKECQDIMPKGELSWNDRRKYNCKVRDCYERKYQSPDYNKTWDEIRKLSDFEIEKRQIQKFECLEKAL
ncbi:unnamed protein product [Medioppia subpectinata]|uniref:Uncharacterized protein n=1 Tax=Medioppia subpectinata TaxID=1979941 RepID=A0A7R9L205_9ACAR|nr:unnamed protein product [Medioppia subpectinata]CAG2113772.1 unnamed protein product [Medioppia subpectinata]